MPNGFSSEEDEEYIQARISYVGFADQLGLEGDKNTIPTIYNLVEEIAVMQDLLLMEVRVYQSGSVLRANLYFKGRRKEYLILRNYRASDSIALAAYYDIPIKVRKNLFEEAIQQ